MRASTKFYISLVLLILITLWTAEVKEVKSKDIKKVYKVQNRIKFIEEINGIKEYHHENGLKILLKKNDSLPLITFSIWYKVGSRNESKGACGLAHFLEHMMFKGTKNYKKGEISEIIQNNGGVFNAFTSSDGTAYYETISPDFLEEVIKIEADRMKGSLLKEEELNLERTVVLSELEGNLNNPETFLDQNVRMAAYKESPYKNPVIGYTPDIKKINSEIMHKFYSQFYNPNNSTIILVGYFNEKNALNLIDNHFGNIKNEITSYSNEEIKKDKPQDKENRFSIKRSGTFKLLEIAYHIVETNNKDIYPLNLIEEILIKGRNSPLQKELVEKSLTTEVSGGAEVNKDPGLFYILIPLTQKASHKRVENIITNEINKLIQNPPSDEEIQAAKNRIKANYLFSLDGTSNQAFNIGYFEIANDWKQSTYWLNEIKKVTKDEIINALKKYFQTKNKTVGYFQPIIQNRENEGRYEVQNINLSRTPHYRSTNINNATSLENLFKTFSYKTKKFTDGSKLLIYDKIDIPVTYISGVISGGSSLVPKKNESDCILISQILEKGSKNYKKENIEKLLDSTGTSIEFSCDEESFKFSLTTLNENLTKSITLLMDILLNPNFSKDEVKKEKEKMIAEIIESKDDTREIAERKFSQTIYNKEHPYYSNDFKEDIKIIKGITMKSLQDTHKKIIKNHKITISLVSNIDKKQLNDFTNLLEQYLTKTNNKDKDDEDRIHIPDTLVRDIPKLETVYVKDKMQSDVFLGHAGNVKRTDPDFYKLHIANYILGGSSLSSTLAKKVRDNAGLVYTIFSYINATHGKGEFGIYFGSNNENVDKGINLIKEEINNFVKVGITDAELKKAKKSVINSFISKYLSTYKNIGDTLIKMEFYSLGSDYINKYPQTINSLKLEDVNSAIKKYIYPNKLNVAIAGEYRKSK
ncbi:MAG: insulinase family protein [Candidatus Melainabacteria bacterium]|nr:insulinase family protein [Candidatus Melainabacteria bacterium]